MAADPNPRPLAGRHHGRRGRLVAAALIAAVAVTVILVGSALGSSPRAGVIPATRIPVGSSTAGPPVPAGFVGLATEYWNVENEVGTDPNQPDTAFEQALRNLAPQGGFSLRIGGDSTDWTWWPIPGMKQPPWVRWTMTPTWAAVTARLVTDLHANLTVGLNMEAGSTRIDDAEVRAIGSALGSAPITYELGNEPELYSHFPFYHDTAGQAVLGRPKTYSLTSMATQWNEMADALPKVRLAGPGYSSLQALPYINQFLSESHRLSVLTVHTYPLKSTRCAGVPPQESQLFAPSSLQVLAQGMSQWAALAHRHGVGLRVDEMNSVTCGGQPGLTNSFGPALWALNALPLYAQAGINGVNFQSRPFTAQNLIQTTHRATGWQIQVQPEYYGLLAFAQLTPPGTRLLKIGPLSGGLYAWAARTPQGQTHVVVTNIGSQPRVVAIPAPAGTAAGRASVETLSAGRGGLTATAGVSLGGQTISARTGNLVGRQVTSSAAATGGAYRVTVAPASAAILTYG